MAENENVIDYDDDVQCGQPQHVEPQPQPQQDQPQHVEPQPQPQQDQPQHVERYEIDTASFFDAAGKRWSEREDMLNWMREQARKAGFRVVIHKSNNKGTPVVHVGCQRGGSYDKRCELKRTKSGKVAREGTGSRKIQCPFHLKGFYYPPSAKWWFHPVNGLHNHKMEPKLEGHINAGKFNAKTKEVVKELTKCLVQPKSILLNLKKKDENNATTLKQVYNARHRIRKAERGDDSEVQHLIQKLEEHHYVHFIRTKSDSSTLQDIFWAHPKSIQLLKSFPSVLIMDSTYKTNMYRMPLFEIVGVTSTAMTYSVAFAFLANEKEDNFRWVLEMLRGVLHSKENMPKAIVTDRDMGLMKAVATVFPDTYALLCQFHIRKNVREHCVKDCKVKPIEGREVKQCDVVDNIMQAWDNVVESPTLESYGDNVIKFREVCKSFPKFLTYVEKTILDVVKKNFVRAWTDKVLHLGNNTTNRVEGAHGVLKKYLMHSGGDLASCWHKVNDMLVVQHTEIQGSFGKSVTVLEHRYKGNFLYSGLEAKVSRAALNFIYEEEARVATLTSAEDCRCVIRTTYGLPCACMLAMKKFHHKSIELDDIHIHWRRLSFEAIEEGDNDFSVMEEWNGIQERLRKVPMSMKLHIKEQMRLLAFPEETIVTPPQMNVPPKGAQKRMRSNAASTSRIPSTWERVDSQNPDSQSSKPKASFRKSKSARIGRPSPSQPKASQIPVPSPRPSPLTSQVSPSPVPVYVPSPLPWNSSQVLEELNPLYYMPLFMQEYIEKYNDVKGDGNCGFSVLLYFR